MVDLSAIIVNYNNFRVLKECLPSLFRSLKGIDAEVIISDNGSTDGSLEWVRDNFPDIRILENGENLGFAEANNRVFAWTQGRYILLLNPDTVVLNGAFGPMMDLLEDNPRVGVVGCKLLNADGSRQISARKFPTLLTYWLRFSGLAHRYPKSRFCGQFNMSHWDGKDARPVDWVSGAALMIRREILTLVGGIDPYFFLTYDEVDWCHRIKNAGYEVWYIPDGEILHLDRQSEPQSNPKPEARIKYLTVERNSRVHYFVKHHGLFYALLVEVFHLAMSAALLTKARLLGTNQPSISIMEMRLLLQLYWHTMLRIPRACFDALTKCDSGRNGLTFKLFVNPYTDLIDHSK